MRALDRKQYAIATDYHLPNLWRAQLNAARIRALDTSTCTFLNSTFRWTTELTIPSGTRLGRYEIRSPLGAGGMGEVYRARDSKLNREVAIKVLPEMFALDADRLARFHREAQVLASLNHPNIAAIYGLEESDGMRALVMELVEGPTLDDLLRVVQSLWTRH